jgi:ABC-type spermidine/putrescine transport system permease subunit II
MAEMVTVTNPASLQDGRDDAYQMVGLDNYSKLLAEGGTRQRDFFLSLKNTVYFVFGVVPTQTILALLLAVIVNQRWLKGKGMFRTAFYFPSITSSVVISIIFMWMFTQGGYNTIIRGFPVMKISPGWMTPMGHPHSRVFGVDRRLLETGAGCGAADIVGLDQRECDHAHYHDPEHVDDHRHHDGHLSGRAAKHSVLGLRGGPD